MVTIEQFFNGLAVWAAAHPEQAIGVVVAVLGYAAAWKKSGKPPIGRLPWKKLKETFRDLKYTYADVPRPKGVPGVVTEAASDEIDDELRRNHHFESAPYAYYYDREVLNLRRPEGLRREPQTGELMEMELHPRAFALDDGRTLWLAHHEPNRYSEPGDHYEEVEFSWDRGQADFEAALNEAGFDTDLVDSERDAGLTVVSPDKQGDGWLIRLLTRYIPG